MTTFEPNLVQINPPDAPDRLTDSVIQSLSRQMNTRLWWSPAKTIVLGLLTGGLLPLIVLPLKFRRFVRAEREHLWHFAEWFRLQSPTPESQKFEDAVDKLKFRLTFWIGALLMAGLAVAWGWSKLAALSAQPIVLVSPFGPSVSLHQVEFLTPDLVFSFTARLPHLYKEFAAMPHVLVAAEGFAFLLIAAQLICLWLVLLHINHIRRATELFNAAAKKAGVDPVDLPRAFHKVGWFWIVGMVGLAALGAWWGVPMMLAAAAQARYISGSGRDLRLAFAARAFNLAASQRPSIGLTLPKPIRGRKCAAENCNANAVIGMQYCPQCGSRVEAVVQRHAG